MIHQTSTDCAGLSQLLGGELTNTLRHGTQAVGELWVVRGEVRSDGANVPG